MVRKFLAGSVVLGVMLAVLSSTAYAANECAGYAWQTYSTTPIDGGACQALGISSSVTTTNCSPVGATITMCDDYETTGGHEMVRTCQAECLGGGGPGGGGPGLTPEQLAALADVLALLDQIQNLKNGSDEKAYLTIKLYQKLAKLKTTLGEDDAELAGLIAIIDSSLAKVNSYRAAGHGLGPQAAAMIDKQIKEASAQQVVAGINNLVTQGYTSGDPVLVASGFETFTKEDYSYTSLHDTLSISRQFRSNQTSLNSSFGSSWFFNYDTNVVAGRKPFIKEREELTEELKNEAQRLADLAVAELNKAYDALEQAQVVAQRMASTKQEIDSTRSQIDSLAAEASSLASLAQSAASSAASKASIADMDEAYDKANQAASLANQASNSASTAASNASQAATIASEANQMVAAAGDNALAMGETVADIEEGKEALEVILAARIAEAAEAAAEARKEEEIYPLDPYPADPTVYFGPGYVKLLTEDNTPIVYQEQENEPGLYLPISDNNSYTDKIIAGERGFILVDKHQNSREFDHNGKGIYLLAKIIDSNDNTTTFTRSGDRLDTITDAVGRTTTFTYNDDGYIEKIIDAVGGVHKYIYNGSLLATYSDPMGYLRSYSYDDAGRMISRLDPMGASYSYLYDAQSRVTKETDKEGFTFLYDYNPENRTTRVTDRRDQTTTYIYNEANRLERTIYPDGSEVSHAYDDHNNVVATNDEMGVSTYFNYNDNNDITAVINGLGERTTITYEANFNKVASVTDPNGNSRYFSYDNKGNLINITHPDGTTRSIAYNSQGLPVRVTDERGNPTDLAYDGHGYLARVTFADGTSQQATRDNIGRLVYLTDELGGVSSFTYNKLGSLLERIDQLGAATRFEYDDLQRKTRETDARGNSTSYQYSKRGDLLVTTDQLGNEVSYEYDGEGNMLRKTYPNSTGIDFGYDARGWLVQKITFPGNLETVYSYNGRGQKLQAQDANGNITSFSYDLVGRMTAKTDATGSAIAADYDAAGNVVEVRDGNGNPISYGYDSLNRLISHTNGLGNAILYNYDAAGNLSQKQNPDGTILDYSYDSRDRLTAVAYPDGTSKSFSYDQAGRMVEMANSETSETRAYDAVGRLLSVTDKYTGRIDYSYDALGNRTSMVDPDSGQFSYSYDAKTRLISFTDPQGKNTSYSYDVMGRVTSIDYPNGTRTEQAYNSDNRLESMVTSSSRDGVLASFVYSYDNVGNKLSMVDEFGTTSYQYDAAYRLVQVDYPLRDGELKMPGSSQSEVAENSNKNHGSTQGKGKKKGHQKGKGNNGKGNPKPAKQPLPTSVAYVYDAAGNRLSKTDDYATVSYAYNAANQLIQEGSTVYSYDLNGNRVSKQDDSGVSSYLYNHDNFLVQFTDPEDTVTQYGYDAINRRVYKAQGEKNKDITSYLYDGLEVLQEVTGQNAQKITAYYRSKGKIITQQKYNVSQGGNSRYQNRPNGRQLFYAYDGLGSVAALSNHQGMQKTRYQYDAFGEVVAGDLTDNQYTFTGKRLDPESNLYHFHFRKYDPTAGVWTTADPIGVLGGVNLYQYVQSNPVNFRDWLGLELEEGEDGFNDQGNGGWGTESEEESDERGEGLDDGNGNESIGLGDPKEKGFWESFWDNLEKQSAWAAALATHGKNLPLAAVYTAIAAIANAVNINFYSDTLVQDLVQEGVLATASTRFPVLDYFVGETIDGLSDSEKECDKQ